MRLIRGLHNLRPDDRGCVATIGNFDGVHLGHRAVFQHLLHLGREHGLPATVITFEPQPLEYLAPERAPARLTRLREKARAIAANGIERLMVLEFGAALATLEPDTFVKRLLIEGLDARALIVGDDFRFGHRRAGDFGLLERLGARHGFSVENLRAITQGSERISSTRVREALAQGDLERARHLLGRPFSIEGRVAHGDKRGRTLGFPTANLHLHRRVSPLSGVYAVRVEGLDERPWPGVANVGARPTIDGGSAARLEVHLFDFDRHIYGRHLRVEFVLRLRDEQRFASFEALRAQIERDAASARAALGLAPGRLGQTGDQASYTDHTEVFR